MQAATEGHGDGTTLKRKNKSNSRSNSNEPRHRGSTGKESQHSNQYTLQLGNMGRGPVHESNVSFKQESNQNSMLN